MSSAQSPELGHGEGCIRETDRSLSMSKMLLSLSM